MTGHCLPVGRISDKRMTYREVGNAGNAGAIPSPPISGLAVNGHRLRYSTQPLHGVTEEIPCRYPCHPNHNSPADSWLNTAGGNLRHSGKWAQQEFR